MDLMHTEVFHHLMVVGLVILCGGGMSSSMHVDNIKKKDIWILGKGSTKGLDGTTLTAEKQIATNFSEQHNKFCLRLHYNEVNSYIFGNSVEIYKFKTTDF